MRNEHWDAGRLVGRAEAIAEIQRAAAEEKGALLVRMPTFREMMRKEIIAELRAWAQGMAGDYLENHGQVEWAQMLAKLDELEK